MEGSEAVSGGGRTVEYRPQRVRTILRPQAMNGGGWGWGLEPYEGCEFGCAFCAARMDRELTGYWRDFERKISVTVNAARVLEHALRTQDLERRPLLLGARTDPWQPAESRFRVTRELLEVMVRHSGSIELRVNTRSALVARDVDLLRQLSERAPVIVCFSIPSADEGLNRLLEPRAPSLSERLVALEALAGAGVTVGVSLSPLLPGMSAHELGVELLLHRAARAGASFAGFQYLSFAPGMRERFLRHAREGAPALVDRVEKLPPSSSEEQRQELLAAFSSRCDVEGLIRLDEVMTPALPVAVAS